jgi:hypothetical protein
MDPTDLRDWVVASMRSAGWTVTPAGAYALRVSRHADVVGPSYVGTVLWGQQGLPRNATLLVSGNGRVTIPQPSEPGLIPKEFWTIGFDTTDTAGTIQEDAVVEATVDGVAIDANVTAGMTPTNVAAALYSAMVQAGVTDALLSSYGFITFTLDTAGQYATDVSLQFTGPDGTPVDWLEMGIGIPWAGDLPPGPTSGSGQRAVADAVAIEAKVTSSVPPSAVAPAPYQSRPRAGVPSAVLMGGEVTFLYHTAGQVTTGVSPTSAGPPSPEGLADRLDVGIPGASYFTNPEVIFSW